MSADKVIEVVRERAESEHGGRRVRARVLLTDDDDGTVVEVIDVPPPATAPPRAS
jgi:hypothetical protein